MPPPPPLKDYDGEDVDRRIAGPWSSEPEPPTPLRDRVSGDGKTGPPPTIREPQKTATPADVAVTPPDESLTPTADKEAPSDENAPASSLPGVVVPEEAIRDRVVIMLLFHEIVQLEQIRNAWEKWNRTNPTKADSFWRFLANQKEMPADRIYEVASEVYAFPKAQFVAQQVPSFIQKCEAILPANAWHDLRQFGLVPVGQERRQGAPDRWIFATHDPSHPDAVRVIRNAGVGHYDIRYAPKAELSALLGNVQKKRNTYLDQVNRAASHRELDPAADERRGLIDETALSAQIKSSTLINLFEAMLIEAVRGGASDIHVFPGWSGHVEIHFRLDGELVSWRTERGFHPQAVLAVIKNNASNIDAFERDAAQDGFLQRTIDDMLIRFRVSVIPVTSSNETERHESVVIRVLDDRKATGNLDTIIPHKEDRARFEWALHQPQGMVILTGPTGSGKTTTLAAALDHVATSKVNVITIEDPVEYATPNIRQVRINHKLSLENALRFILRHDPDIIMVGEIRDRETADLAIKLANTGHLTFTTVHANDAVGVVSRLFKMGIEPFLIANAINLVVAQRLLRVLCPECKQREEPDAMWLERLGFSHDEIQQATLFRAGDDAMCATCRGLGFKGRRAITETLVFSPEIRRIILNAGATVNEAELRNLALQEGMRTLQDAAREMVMKGETPFRELLRAVPTEYKPSSRES